MTKIYDGVTISPRTKIEGHEQSFIGTGAYIFTPLLKMAIGSHINARCIVAGRGSLTMGAYSVLGYDVLVLTSSDTAWGNMSDFCRDKERCIRTEDISIGPHAFVGSKSILLPGAHVPEGAVLALKSVFGPDDKLEPWEIRYADGHRIKREMKREVVPT
ncbi:MAG: hypothetical protein PHI12_13740 [Dehalococcoidales bacterium]|jgi:acetyltransferase-like isoleucine patch superfamily enzyme|nr:hypothetical protein [Sphaerochaeta sp.]MDD5511855.1 hypothetical protein [Dehalococcoidales bacterium]